MSQKLLLADDSVTIQRVIELTFADEDVTVVAVGDGRQAIERIAAERPDIVLADVGMPGCDGYEVSKFVKGAPGLAHVPVLLLTGAFEPVDEARAAESGCDGILAKPFEPQQLISKVRELLGGATARVRAEPAAGAVPDAATLAAMGAGPGVSALLEAAPPADNQRNTPSEDLDLIAGPADHRDRSTLDDYFDRLDAAFASLSAAPAPEAAPHDEEGGGRSMFDLSAFDPPAPQAYRDAEVELPPPPAPAAIPAAGQEAPVAATGIVEAFNALLEAERTGVPAPPIGFPAAQAAGPSADEMTDLVYERVVERLADRALTAQVADIVRQTAERIVRAEVEALKARVETRHPRG